MYMYTMGIFKIYLFMRICAYISNYLYLYVLIFLTHFLISTNYTHYLTSNIKPRISCPYSQINPANLPTSTNSIP